MAGELQLGGTTLATHTGSGASAKINLDSGLVFPSGHVIQTVYKNEIVTSDEASGSTAVQASTFFNKSITAKGNNSVFVINAFVGKTFVQNANSVGKVSLTRNINSTITSINQLEGTGSWGSIAVQTFPYYNAQSYCWVDSSSSCSVGDTIDYVINFVRFSSSGDSFYFIEGSNNGSHCSYVIQEIAE